VLLPKWDGYDGIFREESDQKVFNDLASHSLIQIPVLYPVNDKSFVILIDIFFFVQIACRDLAATDGRTPRSSMRVAWPVSKTFKIRFIFYPHSKKFEFNKAIL